MTAVYIRNPFGVDLAPPVLLPPRRRRLSTLVRRHAVPLDHPFTVSVIAPHEEVRLGAEVWAPHEWKTTAVGRRDTVLITLLPQGGGGGSSGVKIAATVASLVLIIAAPYLAAAGGAGLGNLLGISAASAEKLISGGILVGVAAANAALARSLTPNNRPLYSVSGGGNLPRPDDRRPVAYGECWVQPQLTQPDYFTYSGETMTLFKRVHLTDGDCDIAEVRAGSTTLWRCPQSAGTGRTQLSDGTWALATNTGVRTDVTASFPGARLEFINGQASTLVPSSVSTSPDVSAQQLPFQGDPDPWLGPFRVSAPGTEVNRLQVDFQFPNGYRKNDGKQIPIGLEFQYAPCDEAGLPTGPYQTLQTWFGTVNTSRSLRYSWFKDVPLGEYVVRGRNNVVDYPEKQQAKIQWDALRGHIPDVAVRENRTELAFTVTSGQKLLQTSFSNITVRLRRKGYVWNGMDWEIAPVRKCVDCYIDALRDTVYGRAKANGEMPLAKAKAYREAYSEFDTFDGVISGPVEIMEAAQTLLFPFRAEPIRMGLGYDFVRDEPLAGNIRRAAFSRREIVQGTTKKSWDLDAEGKPAHFIVQYDLEGDFRRKRTAGRSFGPVTRTPKRLSVPGVSGPAHATHIATWLAAGIHFRSVGASFDTELAGRAVMRGDPIAADIWFQQGLKVRSVLAVSGTTLVLDAPVTVAENEVVLLRDRLGRDWGPCAVAQGPQPDQLVLDAGDVAAEEAATSLTLAEVITDPGEHRKWTSLRLGVPASLGTNWLVQRAVPRTRLKSSIDVVLDHPQVWAELDEPIDPESPLGWERIVSDAPDVTGIQAYAVQHTSSLELEWSVATEAGAVRVLVEISYDAGETFETVSDGAAVSGAWPLRFQYEGEVIVLATAFGEGGSPGTPAQKQITTPYPKLPPGTVTPEILGADAATLFDRELQSITGLLGEFVTREVQARRQEVLFGANRASIDRIDTTIATDRVAMADSVLLLTATLNQFFASAGIRFTVVTGVAGVASRIAIEAKVQATGVWTVVGLYFDILETAPGSGVFVGRIRARGDFFEIADASGNVYAAFSGIDGSLIVDRIKSADIDSIKLALNSATKLQSVDDNDTTSWGNSALYGTLWTANFTLTKATDVWIDCQLYHTQVSGPAGGSYRFKLNGVQLREYSIPFTAAMRFVIPKQSLAIGTHTIDIDVGGFGAGGSYRTNPQTLGVFESIR